MNQNIALLIVGMSFATLFARISPLLFPAPKRSSRFSQYFFACVPLALVTALLTPEILTSGGHLDLSYSNFFLIAALPTGLVAYKSKSMGKTVVVGILIMATLRYLSDFLALQ